jgi:hypothetical protein
MIPELFRKQNRVMELEIKSLLGASLSEAETSELAGLRSEFEQRNRHAIRRNMTRCRRLDAHRQRTKHLNIGNYAAAA